MGKSEANLLRESGLPLFFKLANPEAVGIVPPENRLGEAQTTWVRSLSVMQKDALVASAANGVVWRLASDEGGYTMMPLISRYATNTKTGDERDTGKKRSGRSAPMSVTSTR